MFRHSGLFLKFSSFCSPNHLSVFLATIIIWTGFVTSKAAQALIVNGRTDAPPYTVSKNPNLQTIPLLTVGDEVPWLNGSFGNYSPDASRKFAMVGIPDGLGVVETANRNYVFMNHEIGITKFDGTTLPNIPENYIFTYFNNTDPDKIRGARVSVFEFTKDWQVIGGRNLIDTAIDNSVNAGANGTTYNLNTLSGFYENPGNPSDTLNSNVQNGFIGAMSRFCSGFLAQAGFIDNSNGQGVPFWFAPEEDSSSTNRGWAVTANGLASSLDGLGRFSKENVVAPAQYRPLSIGNTSNKTVLLSTEDNSDGELYMWVGNQTTEDPNGFKDGQLYVLQVSNSSTGEVYANETIPEDVPVTSKWVAVPGNIAVGTPGQTPNEITDQLSVYVNGNGVDGKPRSTNFRRLEDIAEDPTQLGTFYFAVTGSTSTLPDGTTRDNQLGKLYRISLNPSNPAGDGVLTLVHTGGFGKGVSFDNLTVLTNGKVWVQEDAAYSTAILGGDPLGDENRQAYIWEFDPNANGGTGSITPVAEMQEDAYPDLGNNPAKYGEWESSGIVQVGNLAPNTPWTLFDVQAHTDLRQNIRFSEGGQLLLIQSETVPEPGTVAGLVVFGLSALGMKRKQKKG
jgi:glycerophosphoryl diester phosphodiesterase